MGVVPTIYFCCYLDCTASFTRKIKYDIHIRSHTNDRPFACSFDDCDKSYKSQSHLNRHELSHKNSLKCSVKGCSEVLKTKATLKKHVDIVHEKKITKKYKCNICDEQFNKHNWLQRHMYRHTKVYPHICPMEGCTRGFLMPSLLKRHLKRHKGYTCSAPDCDAVFSKWSAYVSHKKEFHPREYKCDTCNKLFANSTNLKNHKQIHAEERIVYPCEVPKCARYYFNKNYLKRHMKSHHERRVFGCPKELCSRAFKTQKELDDHLINHGKKPRKKKKKHKPSFAAKLAGCVNLNCSNNQECPSQPVVATPEQSTLLPSPVVTEHPANSQAHPNQDPECAEHFVDQEIKANDLNESTIDTRSDEEFELERNLSDYEEITVHIV